MPAICPKCDVDFHSPSKLEAHLARKIPCDAGKYQCEECKNRFTSWEARHRHKKTCKGLQKTKEQLEEELAELHQQIAESTATVLNDEHAQLWEQTGSASAVAENLFDDSVDLASVADQAADQPSQPPVDASLAIIDQAGFFEFGHKKIRKTSETPQRVSVYDLIAAMTDQDSNAASKAFFRLKETYSEVTASSTNFKFAGRGQRDTPVTDARGAVLIMNLLPGKKAAEFRLACADVIVRYLGGDETLVGEIRRNQEVQATAGETNPVRLFAEAVNTTKFYEAGSLTIESATNVQEFRAPQFYFRQVLGKWSNVHPIGRPQDVLSANQMAEVAIIKIGSMGVTERQITHNKQFDRSELLDSCLTSSFTHVETKAKDYWRDKGELYEGLHESKTVRDTELLIVRNQEDYEGYLALVQQLCEKFPYIADKPQEDTTLELSLAQEKSRQIEAEARKAEAEARKAEADFEILKFKIAHGLKIE